VDDWDDFDVDFDTYGYRYGYGRRGSGCGCLTLAFFGAIGTLWLAVWLFAHRHQIELVVAVGGFSTAIYLMRAPIVRAFHHARGVDPTAVPVALAAVKAGAPTHTAGLVGIGAESYHAPLGAPSKCVFHRVVVERIHPHQVILEARSSDDIVLDDGMGARIRVHLDGVAWSFARKHEITSSPEVQDPLVAQFLAERGIRVDFPVHVIVEWIAPHELVFVRGIVRESAPPSAGADYRTSEHTELEMRAAPKQRVIVSLDALGAKSAPRG
jgi:hypothetical protein